MSAARIQISSAPFSNVKQINKNTGGNNISQTINGNNHNHVGHKHRHVGPKYKHIGGHKLNHTGRKPVFKNVFKPTISIGGLTNNNGTQNSGGATNQSDSSGSPTININLIINLILALKGKEPSSTSGSGSAGDTGSTSDIAKKPVTTRRPVSSGSPLLKSLSPEDRNRAKGLDLKAKGSDGKPKYLIGKGKDGKPRLYQQEKPGEYKAINKAPDGSNELEPKGITTDKHGVSQAGSGSKTSSPLILDTNKDGKVSAQHGMGVDVNGDGRADGAAVGGDKMLTMGDRNGNGKIDGTEVFGDKTVDPFTNQPINAKNGFEALRQVAQSAQQATGMQIVDANGKVDVQKLNQALESAGKGKLGMISGNNTTRPEALGDVKSIDTQGYTDRGQLSGNVQHRQLGSYTDSSGQKQKVNDVWFKNA